MLSSERCAELAEKCRGFRRDLIRLLHSIQTGHPGGSLSAVEILTVLYNGILAVDADNPSKPDRDIFILGKGHAAPMLYIVLADRGFFPTDWLPTLRQLDSRLQGHPCANKLPGVELSTGPLGLGISAAVGRAVAAKADGTAEKIYVMLGDGEMQEGIVWEAALAASKYRLDNLVAILDNNGVQLDGITDDIMPLGDVKAKWTAFGWHCLEADGNDVTQVYEALTAAREWTGGKPVMLIANTVKGRGVSFMEGKNIWHGKPISDDEFAAAMRELEDRQ